MYNNKTQYIGLIVDCKVSEMKYTLLVYSDCYYKKVNANLDCLLMVFHKCYQSVSTSYKHFASVYLEFFPETFKRNLPIFLTILLYIC
jgi:hypothetical protein